MRYLIYLRVSTEQQAHSELGLEAQRHACHEWIKKQKTQGEIFEFIDVVSGTDRSRKELENRPKLMEALGDLHDGDVFLAHKRERLTRDPYLIGMIERIIEKKGSVFKTAIGEMDGDQPHDILMRSIIDAFAQYEALLISTRTKAALARKKARGERLGHIPYGFILKDKKLEIEPYEADALRRMNNMRKKSMTFREIASKLNLEGIKPRNMPHSSGQWTYGAVGRVIKNYKKIGSRV